MGPGAALSDPSSLDRDTSGNHGEGEEGWGRGGALVFFVSCVRSPGASTETKRHESGKAERPLVLLALELRDISNHTGFFFFWPKQNTGTPRKVRWALGLLRALASERGHSDPREGPSSGRSYGLSEKAYSTGLADCGHLATLSSKLTYCKGDGAAAWGGVLY